MGGLYLISTIKRLLYLWDINKDFFLEPTLQALRFDDALEFAVFSLGHSRVGISGAYWAGGGDEYGHSQLPHIIFSVASS